MSTASNREEFNRLLEESGILDSISRVLVALYEESEQPSDPMSYIKEHLGCPKGVDPAALRAENESLRRDILALEAELQSIRASKWAVY